MTKNLKKKKTVEKTLSSKLNPDQEPCFARKGEFYGHALTTRFWVDLNIDTNLYLYLSIKLPEVFVGRLRGP